MKKVKVVKKETGLNFRVGIVESGYKVLNDKCTLLEGKLNQLNVDHGSIHPDRIALLVFKNAKPYLWAYLLAQVVLAVVLLVAILFR